MTNYLKFFWLLPAIAFLLPVLMMILMIAAPPGGLGAIASDIYQKLFWITPAVGIIVLLILLVLVIIHRTLLRKVYPLRTLALALLDVIAPAVFLVLQVVFSGFLR
jgi:hypothetical protein